MKFPPPSCAAEPGGPGRRGRRRQPGPGPLPTLPSPRRPPPPPRRSAGTPLLVGAGPRPYRCRIGAARRCRRGCCSWRSRPPSCRCAPGVPSAVPAAARCLLAHTLRSGGGWGRGGLAACLTQLPWQPIHSAAAGAAAAPLRSAAEARGETRGAGRGGPGRGSRRHGAAREAERGPRGESGVASFGRRGRLSSAAPPAPGRGREKDEPRGPPAAPGAPPLPDRGARRHRVSRSGRGAAETLPCPAAGDAR